MPKIKFIYLLVSSGFATQYEAEQHTYPCGTNEWCFLNPFTKDHASSNENGSISTYKYDPANQSHNKCLANNEIAA